MTHSPGYDGSPAWSRDGRTIAYVSDARGFGMYDVLAVSVDGSWADPLLLGPLPWPHTWYYGPAWSLDGSALAVEVCKSSDDAACMPDASIATAKADGSGLTMLPTRGMASQPTWSPGGRVIAYTSRGCGDSTCGEAIRYVRLGTGDGDIIVTNGHSPAWRPAVP